MLTCVGGRELALPAAAVLFCFHAFIIPFGGISLQPNAGLFSRKIKKIWKKEEKVKRQWGFSRRNILF